MHRTWSLLLTMGALLNPTRIMADEPKATWPKVKPIQANNVFECLKACNSSIEEAEDFCRKLPADNKKRKALCWSAIYAGKAACQVFCRGEFGPPTRH